MTLSQTFLDFIMIKPVNQGYISITIKMAPHKDLEEKYQALQLLSELGNTSEAKSIISSEIGVSRSTLNRWIQKLDQYGTLTRKPGSGRKSVLTIENEIDIHLMATQNQWMTPENIRFELGKFIISTSFK